jgi:hypothetical protein
MLGKWLSNLKWALVIAIFAGPAFAYWSYTEAQTLKRVVAEGAETPAIIDGGESRSGRRSGTTYKLHAIWTDAAGAEHAENITISSEYAGKVIEDDFLLIDEAVVKYLPSEPAAPVIVAEDGPTLIADKELMIMLGGGGGVAGLLGSGIFFLAGRRKPQPARTPAGA